MRYGGSISLVLNKQVLCMIFLGIITYIAILAFVFMLSSAYAAGGVRGLVGLVIWIFICGLIAAALHKDKEE